MDSWTRQGDSYSFLRSAPRNISLCHRDGTPNHVEIFDIINVSNQQSAISETTCLCDIFGDDCESPSLASSPALETFVPSPIDAAVSPPVDDLNDSTGSYHTAQGSSEGEEGFEDSTEGLQNQLSPPAELTEGNGMISEQQAVDQESVENFQPNSKSPVQQPPSPSSLPGVPESIRGERTPSPGHNCSPCPSSARTLSSLSSSSLETRESPLLPFPGQAESEQETCAGRPNNLWNQSFNQSPSSDLVASSLSGTGNTSPANTSFQEIRGASVSPGAESNYESSNSPATFAVGSAADVIKSAEEVKGRLSSPFTSSRNGLNTPQGSSISPDHTGRVSLPDLFSRGSTPEVEDSSDSQELISHPRPSSENNLDLPIYSGSAESTPAPRYTPPSPVISLSSSPALGHSSASPGLKDIDPSIEIERTSSPEERGTSIPSPHSSSQTRPISTSSDLSTHSSLVHYSLTPSPDIRGHCGPKEQTFPAPSPEIRITSSSPEVTDREANSDFTFVHPHFEFQRPRSLNSSPHITGISYSVIQPEDRGSPPFPELDHFSPQEFDNASQSLDDGTLSLDRSSVHSLPETAVSPHDSCSEVPLAHLFRYLTPSPQLGNPSPSPERKSPSAQLSSREPSPLRSSPTINKPRTISRESSLHFSNPSSPQNIPEFQETSSSPRIAELHAAENLVTSSVSPLNGIDHKGQSLIDVEDIHAVQVIQLSQPSLVKEESRRPLNTEVQVTQTNADEKSVLTTSAGIGINIFPLCTNPPIHNWCTSPDLQLCDIEIPPVHKAKSDRTVQILENQLPPFISYPLKPASNLPTNCSVKNSVRKTSPKFPCEISSSPEDMAHHVNRRRTPSPPITRFTPVHIIAPEKPYRQWQDRSCSGAEASSQRGRLKTTASHGENPSVDNRGQPHWARLERQFERERKLQLGGAEGTVIDQQREMKRETKREGKALKKGEEWQGNMGYREEQVDLSFNARNRKGSASSKTAPTSRETRQRLPTAHSYSESLLATRQLQQQQIQHRSASQQDIKVGGPSRRLNPPALLGKNSAPEVTSRPSQSSSSSMGSEFDEADSEVKWFTDVAFSSLSSPEVDYLDMYNSSHRSSTNISQPSTQESLAGVNAASLAYADFSGSASNLDHDDFSFQQQLLHCHDGLESSRRYEMGSFECIDVAMEREDSRKIRRGVPKRQIQLKRKESVEERQDASSESSTSGVAVSSRDMSTRQHSTSMGRQDCFLSAHNTEHQSNRHSKLKKSTSLDETPKSKMATSVIKNVLSKKMQGFDQQPDEQVDDESSPNIENPSEESAGSSFKDASTSEAEHHHPCEDAAGSKGHVGTDVQPSKILGGISSDRPSSCSSNRSLTLSQSKSSEPISDPATEPDLKTPPKTSEDGLNNSDLWKESEDADSSHVPASDSVMQARITTEDPECESTEDHKQGNKSPCLSKSQTVKNAEKKKTSLNVCLTPEMESKLEEVSPDMSLEEEKNQEADADLNASEKEKKAKVPIHKVRDVRRLVKNTYNLSFKATSSIIPPEVSEYFNDDRREPTKNEEMERQVKEGKELEASHENEGLSVVDQTPAVSPQTVKREGKPQSHLQIQCRAVCWKDTKKKTPEKLLKEEPKEQQQSNKDSITEVGPAPATSSPGELSAKGGNSITQTPKLSDKDVTHGDKKAPLLGSIPKQPSKEREVSTAVVLIRDSANRTKVCASPELEEVTRDPVPPTTGGSGHSVSMLLKEKGYQADIGAVVGNGSHGGGAKGLPPKHVNCLEIPLQPSMPSDESQKKKSACSPAMSKSAGAAKLKDEDGTSHAAEGESQTNQKDQEAVEEARKQDSSFPPKSPRRFRQQPIEVKSMANESQKQEMTANSIKSNRPQTIEVKSIAKTQKPIVPPKPTCKFKPADIGAPANDTDKPINTPTTKAQAEERSQTIVVSSPTIYRKISNESAPSQSYTRKLAVSAVSSLKPPSSKKVTAISSASHQSSTDTDGPSDTGVQEPTRTSPQSSRYTQPSSVPQTAAESTTGPAAGRGADPMSDHTPQHTSGAGKENHPAVVDPEPPLQYPKKVYSHESATSYTPKQPVPSTQAPGYPQQQLRRSLSSERPKRTEDLHYYSSGDPPSYDERESFSPLMLPDLTPRRLNRFQTRPPPCSCTSSCPHHPGPAPPTHHRSPHNLTPPAPSHSPGQGVPYPITQPPPRAHQYRADPQPIGFQTSLSPKSSPLGPTQPTTMYQPPSFPSHATVMPPCPADRPMPPMDPRRHPVHRSPQQQPAGMSGAPFSDGGHGHSPTLPPLDPQYLCGPQNLGHSYGSEYGGDNSSLYSESSYGHTPRRVLLDPETGKYFYIEVPMQPLRKMLFDPETGQYVEVLIPQQAMSHSGLYPPSAAPYPSIHNPSMYASASQYMPYTAPPPPPHPQTQLQPPRYPEAAAATALHPNSQSVSYRNSSALASKPENQSHPPLDQSYLESMYYVPTGMTASPNTTPPVYYHKHPPSIPPTGGKRS
ncbi:uncharacterized protein si:ch73-43g23.1 [Synchiropus splendidus]|uniref:uncharacterized protein si:ch73-43g23.1 n=1 Tax=Synchiropus splendidus TaxID=270530 RepID=UPI00237E32DC|nr:uncharacterized protein si:ch73-43g23.1 [Synchiropus splendidus]